MDHEVEAASAGAVVLSASGSLWLAEFDSADTYAKVRNRLDELVGPGWIVHRVDGEIGAASLMKSDGAPRNRRAERVIGALKAAASPMLFGDVAIIGLEATSGIPSWRYFTSLDEDYIAMINAEHTLARYEE